MLVDIHTHNNNDSNIFGIRSLSVKRLENGIDVNSGKYCSVGLHPWDIDDSFIPYIEKLNTIVQKKNVLMIGECGLDKNIDLPFNIQMEVFQNQIDISEKKSKPLIIHCVGYFNELIKLKNQINPKQKWVVHGFRAKPQLAKQLLKAGFYLSFGEYFNEESLKLMPIEKLLIETDESQKSIKDIYEIIALTRGESMDELLGGKLFVENLTGKT